MFEMFASFLAFSGCVRNETFSWWLELFLLTYIFLSSTMQPSKRLHFSSYGVDCNFSRLNEINGKYGKRILFLNFFNSSISADDILDDMFKSAIIFAINWNIKDVSATQTNYKLAVIKFHKFPYKFRPKFMNAKLD